MRCGGQRLAAHHHLRQRATAGFRRVGRRHHAPVAQHRDAVGDAQHFVQLVADKDDRQPLLLQVAQIAEQLVGLLRRQHGGRLVEDQDAGVVIERLEDFDALALADRKILDARRRVEGDAKVLGGGATRACAAARSRWKPPASPRITFSVTVSGAARAKCWVTMPMPRAMASRGARMWANWPLTHTLAGVGMVEAVEDAHERALARAVFAQQGMDFALVQRKIDVVIGHQRAKALGDAGHFDGLHGSWSVCVSVQWCSGKWQWCSVSVSHCARATQLTTATAY